MDDRMERFDAPPQNLGETCDIGDPSDGNRLGRDGIRRSAARDDLEPAIRKPASECGDPILVCNAQKSTSG